MTVGGLGIGGWWRVLMDVRNGGSGSLLEILCIYVGEIWSIILVEDVNVECVRRPSWLHRAILWGCRVTCRFGKQCGGFPAFDIEL